eukprot:scaffold10905_cov33-Phaeocystis_antarctica.AAC.2
MRRLATLPPYPSTLPLLSLSLSLTLTLALPLSLTLPRGARQHFKEHAVLCFAATLKGKDKVDPGHPLYRVCKEWHARRTLPMSAVRPTKLGAAGGHTPGGGAAQYSAQGGRHPGGGAGGGLLHVDGHGHLGRMERAAHPAAGAAAAGVDLPAPRQGAQGGPAP